MEAVLKTRRRMSKADKGAEEEGMVRRRRGRKRKRRRRRRLREMRPPGRVGTLSLPPLLAGILRPVEWRTPSLPLRGCPALLKL